MKRIKLILGLASFILTLSFGNVLFAQTTTYYFRDTTHAPSGQTLRQLLTSQGSTIDSINCGTAAGAATFSVGFIRIHQKTVGALSSWEDLQFGENIIVGTRSTDGEGMQSVSWNCPRMPMSANDCIKVQLKIHDAAGNDCGLDYCTIRLGNSRLLDTTWTIYLYTYKSGTIYRIYFGTSTYNSRIENVSTDNGEFGLKFSSGGSVYKVAIVPASIVNAHIPNKLKIYLNGMVYRIVILDYWWSDYCTPIRIYTERGIKALQKKW